MKKILSLIIAIFMFIPITNVFALKCGDGTAFDSDTSSFTCADVSGENLTFEHNGEDYSKYFKLDDNRSTVRITDDSFIKNYDSSTEMIIIVVKDGTSSIPVRIKNPNYVAPTTTTTTSSTTTENPNSKTYTVILQDGEEKTEKKCEVTGNNETCSISLPTITKEGFNGWGTADACKEGSRGTIKVDKDTTYYACYNETKKDVQKLFLNSLKLTDKDTKKEIKFGTFSIKKTKYDFKVLNDVKSIDVETDVDEGITVTVDGNEELNEGKNEITITLTDKDNNEAVYTLNVTRLKKGETISNIHYLKSLVIGGIEGFKFNKNTFNYTITIGSKISELQITVDPESSDDKTQIIGNSNLENGSVIKIFVIGEDGEKTIYNINIQKESSLNIMVIVVGVICAIIVILTILIFIKSNKKNSGNTTDKPKKEKKKDKKNKENNKEVLTNTNDSANIEVLKF